MSNLKNLKRGDTVFVEWLDTGNVAKTSVIYIDEAVIDTWRGSFGAENGSSVESCNSACHADSAEMRDRFEKSPAAFSEGVEFNTFTGGLLATPCTFCGK